MENKSQEIIAIIPDSDRIIYMIWNEQELIALNYMQGASDIEHFDEHKKNDEKLLKFVQNRIDEGRYAHDNIISRIDQLLWDYMAVQDIKLALIEFKKAARILNNMWQDKHEDVDKILNKQYPFRSCFHELAYDIEWWGDDKQKP